MELAVTHASLLFKNRTSFGVEGLAVVFMVDRVVDIPMSIMSKVPVLHMGSGEMERESPSHPLILHIWDSHPLVCLYTPTHTHTLREWGKKVLRV